jgi:hypothetical protein
MSTQQWGPLEVECDSPPYSIVRACTRIGLRTPEDVRWCRLSGLQEPTANWRQLIRHPWMLFGGAKNGQSKSCVCGHTLPRLDEYTFTMISGNERSYQLGQCGRCCTVFWEEA